MSNSSNRRRRRSSPNRILWPFAILLGAVTTTAVACVVATIYWSTLPDRTQSKLYAIKSDSGSLWTCLDYAGHGFRDIQLDQGNPFSGGLPIRQPPEWALADVSLDDAQAGMRARYRVVAAGWPRSSFRAQSHRWDKTSGFVNVLPPGTMEGGISVKASDTPLNLSIPAIPYLPIWPGIIINTIFYATIWYFILLTIRSTRHLRRYRQGHCPTCAYDLKHNYTTGCPECGWNEPTHRSNGAPERSQG